MPIRSLIIAACLFGQAAIAQTPTEQPTIQLSLDDARVIATQALFSGDPAVAYQLANGLLQVDPDDRLALLIIASAAPQLGKPAEGRQAGARAWELSETDAQRYEAARLTALAAANEERYSIAMFWLRRALTVAPTEAEAERTRTDAAQVRRINPWSNSLKFSLVPSNNVNGGSSEETYGGGYLSADAQALTGVTGTVELRTQYRFSNSQTRQTVVGIRYRGARVALTQKTFDDPVNPTGVTVLSNSDFSSDQLASYFNRTYALENGTFTAGLEFGFVNYAGEPYYNYRRMILSRAFSIAPTTSLRFTTLYEDQRFEAVTVTPVDRYSVNATLINIREGNDRVTATLGYIVNQTDRDNFNYEDWSLRATYDFAQPVGSVKVGLGAGVRWTDYPRYFLTFSELPGGRQDTTFTYDINFGFPTISYAGFAPTLTLSGSNAKSNASRFTRDSLSVGFVIGSTF